MELIASYFSKFFDVYSICCKNCGIAKDELGLSRVTPENPIESMCNPKTKPIF